MASARCVPCPQLTTQPHNSGKHGSTRTAWRAALRWRGASSYQARHCWRTGCSLRFIPLAKQ